MNVYILHALTVSINIGITFRRKYYDIIGKVSSEIIYSPDLMALVLRSRRLRGGLMGNLVDIF